MSLLTAELRRFLDKQVVGALATRSSQGSVHQSLVYYARHGDGLLISTLSKRRKALDVEQSGWASLCVMGHAPPFPSLTVSGAATLRRSEIGLATATVVQRMLALEEPARARSRTTATRTARSPISERSKRCSKPSEMRSWACATKA